MPVMIMMMCEVSNERASVLQGGGWRVTEQGVGVTT